MTLHTEQGSTLVAVCPSPAIDVHRSATEPSVQTVVLVKPVCGSRAVLADLCLYEDACFMSLCWASAKSYLGTFFGFWFRAMRRDVPLCTPLSTSVETNWSCSGLSLPPSSPNSAAHSVLSTHLQAFTPYEVLIALMEFRWALLTHFLSRGPIWKPLNWHYFPEPPIFLPLVKHLLFCWWWSAVMQIISRSISGESKHFVEGVEFFC